MELEKISQLASILYFFSMKLLCTFYVSCMVLCSLSTTQFIPHLTPQTGYYYYRWENGDLKILIFFAQVHIAGKWQKWEKDKVWLQTSFKYTVASSLVHFCKILWIFRSFSHSYFEHIGGLVTLSQRKVLRQTVYPNTTLVISSI